MAHDRLQSALLFVVIALVAACGGGSDVVVLRGGRVIDPESGLDAVRNVVIRDGTIEAVTDEAIEGDRIIDATGLVVAPGFIDLHEHAHSEDAYALMVQDGVTSAFELELGTGDVAAWYAERAGGQIVNYGVSIGHIRVRMIVMGDEGDLFPSGPGGDTAASAEQIAEMERLIREGLSQGAVAAGFGTAYTPAATMDEIETMFRLAAAENASAHVHVGGGLQGLRETIETAKRAGVALHVVHANSSGGEQTVAFLEIIEEALDAGQDVTTEAYPYAAGMTSIESALFDDWEAWDDSAFASFQWVETGERLTRKTFGSYRERGGEVIIHDRTEEMTLAAIATPLTMIASDGFFVNGRGHPRTSGTYAKVLGHYVREQGAVDLMDALRRMTIEPAKRLEARVPAMRAKGRVQVGADADLTVFDPETVIDRSTYLDATIPSEGIEYVFVNGVLVVDQGALVPGVRPGRAVRAEVSQAAEVTSAMGPA
jgi:N-acyl-D-aspartate/D-glutamate deacylase